MIEDIQNKLQDIRNPTAAMMVLLREMDLETDSDVGGDGPAPGTKQHMMSTRTSWYLNIKRFPHRHMRTPNCVQC